jgi:hypothetical protein
LLYFKLTSFFYALRTELLKPKSIFIAIRSERHVINVHIGKVEKTIIYKIYQIQMNYSRESISTDLNFDQYTDQCTELRFICPFDDIYIYIYIYIPNVILFCKCLFCQYSSNNQNNTFIHKPTLMNTSLRKGYVASIRMKR